MTMQAWTFLALAWGIIIASTGYCFARLLGSERQFGHHEDDLV
jgi:hypothetical protein